MSHCTCGRTTRAPFCDNSHALTEEQYKERTERLSKFFKKQTSDSPQIGDIRITGTGKLEKFREGYWQESPQNDSH